MKTANEKTKEMDMLNGGLAGKLILFAILIVSLSVGPNAALRRCGSWISAGQSDMRMKSIL